MKISSDQSAIFTLIFLFSAMTGCHTPAVKDIEGNKYRTVKIGTQTWMAENLKTTKYNDGTEIQLMENYDDWVELSAPAYCWFGNDSANREIYGGLYNWYTVQTDKLCPDGWHVPSDEEWKELRRILGDDGTAGDALKEKGTRYWKSPNEGATNSSRFTALAGGYRSFDGTFNLLKSDGYWWSSTESVWYRKSPDSIPTIAFYMNLRYDDHDIYRNASEKSNGFNIRCIKDQE
jgi:uncharacterized protein (TIGR02145 family)